MLVTSFGKCGSFHTYDLCNRISLEVNPFGKPRETNKKQLLSCHDPCKDSFFHYTTYSVLVKSWWPLQPTFEIKCQEYTKIRDHENERHASYYNNNNQSHESHQTVKWERSWSLGCEPKAGNGVNFRSYFFLPLYSFPFNSLVILEPLTKAFGLMMFRAARLDFDKRISIWLNFASVSCYVCAFFTTIPFVSLTRFDPSTFSMLDHHFHSLLLESQYLITIPLIASSCTSYWPELSGATKAWDGWRQRRIL